MTGWLYLSLERNRVATFPATTRNINAVKGFMSFCSLLSENLKTEVPVT